MPTLIRTRIRRLVQPLEEIHEFEAAIREHTAWPAVSGLPGLPLFLLKILSRAIRSIAVVLDALLHAVRLPQTHDYVCVGYASPNYMMYKAFPYFCLPARLRMVWMYDAWENKLDEIEGAFRMHRINIAFVTSRQATDRLNRSGIKRFAAYWVPEAVTVADYSSKPVGERRIDVLHM